MARGLIPLVALVALSPAPLAAQTDGVWAAYGPANETCAKWTDARKVPGPTYAVRYSWLAGVVTGINFMAGGNILETSDLPSAATWVDAFCKARPTEKVGAGVRELVQKLKSQPPSP